MNLHDYILSNSLADADPSDIAVGFIREVLALADSEQQVAALEPSVRPHASRLTSTLRRAIRSGPAQRPSDSQRSNGGPAQRSSDSQRSDGGPALPKWAQKNAQLITWCRDHESDNYWVPGAGRRKLAEITAGEWEARSRWLGQQAEGTAKAARQAGEFAALIEAAGVLTLGDVLGALA